VFGSRSLHWLDPEHVASECHRVRAPAGCALLIGRVRRERDHIAARLRRRMHELLEATGHMPRRSEAATRALVDACARVGARPIETIEVARWTTTPSPRELLDAWRSKPGLAGLDVPAGVRNHVLDELESWTTSYIGPIDTPHPGAERYLLEGAAFPPSIPST
jgi:hypothetical protein